MSLVAIGTVIFLGLFAGAASAQTFPTSTTSLTGYDATPPLFTRVDAREDDDHSSATVEAEFLDVDSDVDAESDTVQVTEAMVTGCVKTNRKINCKASGMKSGKHSMRVSVKDRYGNRSEREHTFEVTDNVAPIIDSVSATPQGVSVKYHDPAPSSGIASVVVYLDGVKLNCSTGGGGCDNDHDEYDDDHDGYDYDRDDYDDDHDGYDDDHDGADVDHDFYYSDSTGSHDSDGYYNSSDSDSGGTSSTGFTCPINGDLGCGDHTVTVVVTDKAGNSATSTTTVNSGADCTPPATTDNAPAGWQNTDVTVNLTCTDAGSGCASTTYELDAGASQNGAAVAVYGDGIHTITYRSTDVAGNVEADKTATVMIDKTPPDVTTSGSMIVEATGPSGAVADFTVSATDALSGVAGVPTCTPASGSTFPIGATTVNCSAIDVAGNTGTVTMTITVVDTTAPVVTYGGPSDTIYTSDSPTITGTALDAVGVVSAVASIDSGPEIACTVDMAGIVSCPTAGVDYGSHSVVITATDAAGNTGSAAGTFCKSSGRPSLTLFKVRGPYLVAGDPYRWVTVDYRMDNIGPAAYNVSMLSMTATNGIYLASPSPLPALGNIAPGGSVSFSVKYFWPVGTSAYTFTNTACAFDQCFTEYFYP
ncbi:MAG: HYR domain-containing protein [Actinobacteria bacterium]|nr:HYR domain-containing protein [Actinomycetota bacterium]